MTPADHIWHDCTPVPDPDHAKLRDLATWQVPEENFLSLGTRSRGRPRSLDPIVSCGPDGRTWWSGRYVGHVQHAGMSIDIRPRVGRNVLLEWLGMSPERFRVSEEDKAQIDSKTFVVVLIALLWRDSFDRAARFGAIPSKVGIENDHGSVLRGRLDVRGTVRRRQSGWDDLAFTRREKERDTPFACAAVRAFDVLEHHLPTVLNLLSPHLQETLQRFQAVVGRRPPVPTRQDIDRARVSPMTVDYKPFGRFCLDVVNRLGQLSGPEEDERSWTLLVDVAELWEHHVERALVEALPQARVVSGNRATQDAHHLLEDAAGRRRAALIPDFLVLEPGTDRVLGVVDAKYKPHHGPYPPNAREDLYQLTAYLDHFGSGQNPLTGLLAYPALETANDQALKTQDPLDGVWSLRSGKRIAFGRIGLTRDTAGLDMARILDGLGMAMRPAVGPANGPINLVS